MMLGHSHALSGFTIGAATLPVVPFVGSSPYEQAAWVAAVGGFAMLPDLDTGGISTRTLIPRLHGSTVAIMWGPITCLLAKGVARVAGGHRNGTHSLVGVAAMLALAAVMNLHPLGQLVLLAFAIGLALRSLAFAIPGRLEETWVTNLALSFAASWWLLHHSTGSPLWLPIAVGLGALVHIAGDMLTLGGVPLAWPMSKDRQALGLFKTGAVIERFLVAPAFLAVALYLMWVQIDVPTPDVFTALEGALA